MDNESTDCKESSPLAQCVAGGCVAAGVVGYNPCEGAGAVSECSHLVLCGATVFALVLSFLCGSFSKRGMLTGFIRSSRQVMPAIPMLFCIAMVATTWMLGGVVPTLIDYGLRMLHPSFFLVTACVVCAVISVLTGSSWSTIATIGVAFMGIGHLMGFHPGWVAGAVISGAYFGDKISPLSDTTVLASSACGVDLFKHMKYLMLTSVPALFCCACGVSCSRFCVW